MPPPHSFLKGRLHETMLRESVINSVYATEAASSSKQAATPLVYAMFQWTKRCLQLAPLALLLLYCVLISTVKAGAIVAMG